jgi:phosphoribosylanthranilate isomerase
MKIKICGNKNNIEEVIALNPDYMGFILFDKSPRFVSKTELGLIFQKNFGGIKRVAVTVNGELQELINILSEFPFEAVQLHGSESASYCATLKSKFPEILILKAFQVSEDNIPVVSEYDTADYFLFDTASEKFGGSGKSFNWGLISQIETKKPFFLAGGLNPQNIQEALDLKYENLYALDLNSGFETSPGQKDIENLLKVFNRD